MQTVLVALALLGTPAGVQPEAAAAIAKYARTPEEAAFLMAWGTSESHFERRIIDNDCKRWECDRGRARGAFQMHAGAAGKDWERLPGNIDAQTEAAARLVRFALAACRAKGDERILGGFRVLGGLGCDRPLKGETVRLADYRRALGAMR